jgi:hypothetical protein
MQEEAFLRLLEGLLDIVAGTALFLLVLVALATVDI